MTKGDVSGGMRDHVYGEEEAVPVATLLELLPEYPAIGGCSRASVICHALVVREPLFVDDFLAFIDRVLLVDVERGDQGVGDAALSIVCMV